jgi:hypothetical protein
MNQDTLRSIEACRQCAAAASQCATAALVDRDASAKARCAQLALDCAALCRLLVSTAQRQSPATALLRHACEVLCEELAVECEKFDTLYCRRCAVVCRYTATACARGTEVGRIGDHPAVA